MRELKKNKEKKEKTMAEIERGIKKLKQKIKSREKLNNQWVKKKPKRMKRRRRYKQTDYDFNDIMRKNRYRRWKFQQIHAQYRFYKKFYELRMLRAKYNGMDVQCKLHPNAFDATALARDTNERDILPLSGLLKWSQIIAKEKGTEYKYNCK